MGLEELLGDVGDEAPQNIVWMYTRLKECYGLIGHSTQSIEVLALSQKRLGNLLKMGTNVPEANTLSIDSSLQSSYSMIRAALASEDATATASENFTEQSRVDALPDSPEKQYLLALLALRGNIGNEGCMAAMRHLERAIEGKPSNVVYRALAEAIHRSVE